MKLHRAITAAALLSVFPLVARAQEPTPEPKKPGGLNKVAHNVSKASKKAGRDVKETAKAASSDTHVALKKAGNDVKAESKRTTGYTSPKYDSTHKPGGVNKVARDISATSKKTGANVKHTVKKAGADTHGELTKVGKAAKDTLKKKPPM